MLDRERLHRAIQRAKEVLHRRVDLHMRQIKCLDELDEDPGVDMWFADEIIREYESGEMDEVDNE